MISLRRSKKSSALASGVFGERVQHARLLADEEPVAARAARDEQGMLELQIRKRPNDLEGRRRVGRADDAGGRPGRSRGGRGLRIWIRGEGNEPCNNRCNEYRCGKAQANAALES